MTVKVLKEKLAQFDDNMDVFIAERKTDFAYGLVNSVKSKMINLTEEPDDEKVLATQLVVIIDEE